MTFRTAVDVARDRELTNRIIQQRQNLDEIYRKHDGLLRSTCNNQQIVQLVLDFYGVEVVRVGEMFVSNEMLVTLADFDIAMHASSENFAKFRDRLVWTKPEKQKTELINEVCELLKSPDGSGRGGKHSDFDLKIARRKMQTWTVEQIIARRNEIQLKQSLQPKSAQEIRQGLQEYRASLEHPNKKVLPAEFTVERIKRESRESSEFIKKLIRQWGSEAVNDRLLGRS